MKKKMDKQIIKDSLVYVGAFFYAMCIVLSSGAQVIPQEYPGVVSVNYVRNWSSRAPESDPAILKARPVKDVVQTTAYFDGLGRPIQTVTKQGSWETGGSATDMVSTSAYDDMGREQYKYLPSPANNADGQFKLNPFQQQSSFMTSQYGGQGETYFYSKINFEPSVLSRVDKIMPPGNSWAGSSRGIETKIWFNTSTDDVKKWSATDIPNLWGTYAITGAYSANELYKNIVVDEHGKQVIEFKDKEDKVILKKVQISTAPGTEDDGSGRGYINWLCTYYIYDDLNNLRCVIQPEGVKTLAGPANWDLMNYSSGVLLNEQCFRYEYDERNRMVMKKVPGAGEVYMVYDSRDRLVFRQDANLRVNNQWLATLYDGFNRPVVTGIMTYNSSLASLQSLVTSQTQTPSNPNTGIAADLNLTASNTTGTYSALRSVNMLDGFETTTGAEFTAEIIAGPGGPDGETSVVENVLVNKNPIPAGASFSLLTEMFYDNYAWLDSYGNPLPSSYSNIYDSYFQSATGTWPYPVANNPFLQLKGLITGTKIKILGTSSYLYTVSFYDDKGRVIQMQGTNITGGTDIVTTQYTWSGQPLVTIQKQEKSGGGEQTTIIVTQHTYDDLGRLVKTEKKQSNSLVNSNAMSSYKTIAQLEYDKLGQLKTKKIAPAYNSNAGLETLNYEYNIRGWMLGMNRDYAKDASNTNWFGFDLGYDKANNNIIGGQTYANPQYNGNIEGMVWKSKGDGEKRKYDFYYDAANRIMKADFTQYTGSIFNTSAGVDFSMKMGDGTNVTSAYDANGNILQMQQWGLKLNTSPQIDNLTYLYQSNSNKLARITDGVTGDNKLGDFKDGTNSGTDDYNYDANGNLNLDNNKTISSITYNHLNLPSVITVTGKGTITYTYDAAGNKLQKITTENNATVLYNGTNYTSNITTTTTYIGGAVYESKNYSHASLSSLNYTDQLQFIAHEEGRMRPGTTGFNYDYMLKDHLGNVRMVLTEEQKQDIYPAATLEGDVNTSTTAAGYEKTFYTIDPSRIAETSDATDITAYQNNNTIANPYPSGNSGNANINANSVKLYKLNSNTNKTGLGITLKIMAGDKIDIFGKSYYFQNNTGGSGVNSSIPFLEILNGLIGSPGGAVSAAGHGEITGPQLSGLSITTSGIQTLFNNETTESSGNGQRPKAYINYLLFDEQFKCVGSGFSPVGGNSAVKDHHSELQNIAISKNGYVYIYCSNESPVNVFFDNLQVVHTRGPVLEETHYYPFGLIMNGISSRALAFGNPENKKNKFQNQELNNDLEVNYYEFKYRNHDPQIGRFIQLDPLSDEYPYNSTYAFSENRVTSSVELEGLESHDLYDELGPVRERRKLESQLGIKYEESRGEKIIKWGIGIGLGIVGVAPLLVEGSGALLGTATRLFWWAAANPETAIGVAYTIVVAASGYEGPDLPGPGDDFGRMGRKVYDKLVSVGITSDDALKQVARNSYKAIIGTIDEEIKGIKNLEGQAKKAFEIRDQAKDFAREVSGPNLKKAAEERNKIKYGNSIGPSFTDLYNKYYAEATKSGLKGDAAKNKAYQSIIDASKRTDEAIDAQSGIQQ